MRQSVTITGLKEPMFGKAIDELTSIQKLFAHHVNKDNLELWQAPNYKDSPSSDPPNQNSPPKATARLPLRSHQGTVLIRQADSPHQQAVNISMAKIML